MPNEEGMLVIRGEGNGCPPAIGELKYFNPTKSDLQASYTDVNTELCCYEMARHKVRSELEALIREISSQTGEAACWIFYMQILIIDGSLFSKDVTALISEGNSATTALKILKNDFFERLTTKKDIGFIYSMSNEIEDIFSAITEALISGNSPLSLTEYVLISPLPYPIHIARIRKELAGIVIPRDWGTDNIKELIRAMNIPMITVEEEIKSICYEKKAIIDAQNGYLYIDPDMSALEKFSDSLRIATAEGKFRDKIAKMPAFTKSGRRIPILPDLTESRATEYSSPDGVAILKIGSELLTTNENIDEDSLFYFYRQLAEENVGAPVIIRALRDTPGVRISKMHSHPRSNTLDHPELYVIHDRTVPIQLRALMRAAVYGNMLFAVSYDGLASKLEESALVIEGIYEELQKEEREASKISLGAVIDSLPSALLFENILDRCHFFVIDIHSILSQLKMLSPSESIEEKEEQSVYTKSLERIISHICKSAMAKERQVFLSIRDIPTSEELKIALSQKNISLIIPSKKLPDLKKMIMES